MCVRVRECACVVCRQWAYVRVSVSHVYTYVEGGHELFRVCVCLWTCVCTHVYHIAVVTHLLEGPVLLRALRVCVCVCVRVCTRRVLTMGVCACVHLRGVYAHGRVYARTCTTRRW